MIDQPGTKSVPPSVVGELSGGVKEEEVGFNMELVEQDPPSQQTERDGTLSVANRERGSSPG